MPQVQVKKVVAICFLEAVKQVLEQLCAFRVELSQQGMPGPADLPRLYGDVRRMRDYLQRSVSAYQDAVNLDFSADDARLLVAGCRRAIDAIDLRLTEQMIGSDEKVYLQRKRQVLADWAVEIAEKPLLELPLRPISPVSTEGSRALLARLHQKLFGDVSKRTRITGPQPGHHGIAAGVHVFDNVMEGADAEANKVEPERIWSSFGDDVAEEAGNGSRAPAPEVPLLESTRIQDPRLRALVAMDLRSYARAMESADHRVATVLLASIVEAVVIDHAIPRRTDLGLTGTPETWDPVELLLREMGDAAEPKDRAMAYSLFASRNLLRPAVQMVSPTVVTPATLARLQEFAPRLLHVLGMGGVAPETSAAAPDATAVSAPDEQPGA